MTREPGEPTGFDSAIVQAVPRWFARLNGERVFLALTAGRDLRRVSERLAADIGERLHHAEWTVTSDPGQVRTLGLMHDCASCRAGVDQALALLREHPGAELAVGQLWWAGQGGGSPRAGLACLTVRKQVAGILAVLAGGACIGVGVAVGISGRPVPVPGPTVTATAVREVPGPDVTVTVLEPAPPPGGTIATFRGTGSQVTPAFNVPDSTDFTIAWSFSGNADSSGPSNFALSAGSGLSIGLPNIIEAAGSGSALVTGAIGPTDLIDVQAAGSWTIVIKSAS